MRENYYTAAEAAKVLGLEYHTFMWRVREKAEYAHERLGSAYIFDKTYIDQVKKNGERKQHAPNS